MIWCELVNIHIKGKYDKIIRSNFVVGRLMAVSNLSTHLYAGRSRLLIDLFFSDNVKLSVILYKMFRLINVLI